MAIPHFSFKGISKSKEQNIIASASYMARRKMKDNLETNPNKKIKKSFSTTKDHRLTLMMLPNGAPIDYQDPETCWNDLNAVEKDRLAVRFLLPLPKELTEAQGIELAKEWAYQEFVSKGLVVQLSFHAEKDDNGNFHCHGLGSYRQLVSGEWADVKSHKAYVDDKGDPLEKVDSPKLKNGKLQFNKDGSVKTTKGWQELQYDKDGKPLLHDDGTPVLKDIRTPELLPDGTQKMSRNGKYLKPVWKERKIAVTDLERKTAAAEARMLWQDVQNEYFRKHNIRDEQGNILHVDLRSYAVQDKDKPVEERRIPTQHQGIGPAADLIKEENQKEMQRRADVTKRKELEQKVAAADKVISDYVEKEIQPENLFVADYMKPLHEAHAYKNDKCDVAHEIALTGYNAAGKDITVLQEKETLSDREQAKLDFLQQNRTSWYKTLNTINRIRNYNGTAKMEQHCRNKWRGLTGWQRYKYVERRSKRKAEIYKTYLIRQGQFEEHPEQKLPGKVTLDRALTSVINGNSVPSIKSKIDKNQPVRPQFDNIASSTFATWENNAKSDLHLPPTVEQLEVLTVLENTPERIQQISSGSRLTYNNAVPLDYTAESDHNHYLVRMRSIEEDERRAEEERREAERIAKEAAELEAQRKEQERLARIAAERYNAEEDERLLQIAIAEKAKVVDAIIKRTIDKEYWNALKEYDKEVISHQFDGYLNDKEPYIAPPEPTRESVAEKIRKDLMSQNWKNLHQMAEQKNISTHQFVKSVLAAASYHKRKPPEHDDTPTAGMNTQQKKSATVTQPVHQPDKTRDKNKGHGM